MLNLKKQPNIYSAEKKKNTTKYSFTIERRNTLTHALRFSHGKTMATHFHWQVLHVSPYNSPNSLGWKKEGKRAATAKIAWSTKILVTFWIRGWFSCVFAFAFTFAFLFFFFFSFNFFWLEARFSNFWKISVGPVFTRLINLFFNKFFY